MAIQWQYAGQVNILGEGGGTGDLSDETIAKIAAAVLAAAAASPIQANIKQVDDEPVKPIDEDKIIGKKKLEVS